MHTMTHIPPCRIFWLDYLPDDDTDQYAEVAYTPSPDFTHEIAELRRDLGLYTRTDHTLDTLTLAHGQTFFRVCGGTERALVDFYQTRRGCDVQVACGVVRAGVVVSVFETVLVGERLPALAGHCVIYAGSGAYYCPNSHWAWRVIAEHEDGACCQHLRATFD